MTKRVTIVEVVPIPTDATLDFPFARARGDDGEEVWIQLGECYRNGTFADAIQVGDVGTREIEPTTIAGRSYHGFSCPRWKRTKPADTPNP